MNSHSSGSFCILSRLIDSLQRHPSSERQTSIGVLPSIGIDWTF